MTHTSWFYQSKLPLKIRFSLLFLAIATIAIGLGFLKQKNLILNQIEDFVREDKVLSSLNFESNNFSGWSKEDLCCDHSFERVNFPRRAGQYAAKFTISKEDDLKSDGIRGEDGIRVELKRYGLFPLNSERWYSFSIFLPDDYEADEKSREIVAQWHDIPDFILGEQWRAPSLALITTDGKWFISQKWDTNRITPKKNKETKSRAIDVGSYTRGSWTDWVFQVKWSHQSDGFLRVWKNGKLVVNETGPNMYNDILGPYLKVGIYPNWRSSQSKINKRVLYFDEIRIGGSKANYEDVKPR